MVVSHTSTWLRHFCSASLSRMLFAVVVTVEVVVSCVSCAKAADEVTVKHVVATKNARDVFLSIPVYCLPFCRLAHMRKWFECYACNTGQVTAHYAKVYVCSQGTAVGLYLVIFLRLHERLYRLHDGPSLL